MKYKANPVIVDAFKIVEIGSRIGAEITKLGIWLYLENGTSVFADKNMIARFEPQLGDYWVIQEDGYVYLNPKEVFERKYSPVESE